MLSQAHIVTWSVVLVVLIGGCSCKPMTRPAAGDSNERQGQSQQENILLDAMSRSLRSMSQHQRVNKPSSEQDLLHNIIPDERAVNQSTAVEKPSLENKIQHSLTHTWSRGKRSVQSHHVSVGFRINNDSHHVPGDIRLPEEVGHAPVAGYVKYFEEVESGPLERARRWRCFCKTLHPRHYAAPPSGKKPKARIVCVCREVS